MLQIFKTIKYIMNHPMRSSVGLNGGLARFIMWQFSTRLLGRNTKLIPWINDSQLLIKKGHASSTVQYYVGMDDYEIMCFLIHVLIEQDCFWDIGANIGIYTILASAVCKANTLAFEPGDEAFDILTQNIQQNRIENLVHVFKKGVGRYNTEIGFTTGLDSNNHIIDKGNKDAKCIEIVPLDSVKEICPLIIKMDIEGYEAEALLGAKKILENSDLKAIVIELNGLGEQYGHSDQEIDHLLRDYGFQPYSYSPKTRSLEQTQYSKECDNYIYIRDVEFVKMRIKNGKNVKLWGKIIA